MGLTDADFVADLLADGEWHSTHDILRYSFDQRGCGLTVHSRISELRDPRKRGLHIEYRRVPGERAHGHQYRLRVVQQAPAGLDGDAAPGPLGLPESESTPGIPFPGAAEAPPACLLPPGAAASAVLRQPTLWEAA